MKLDLSHHEAQALEEMLTEAVIVERELLKEKGLGFHGLPTKAETELRIATQETLLSRLKLLLHEGTQQ